MEIQRALRKSIILLKLTYEVETTNESKQCKVKTVEIVI